METCARCLMSFQRHLVVKARCTRRWRGHNFDAANAEGAAGAAVAGVLGMHVRTTSDLEAFLRRAFVRAYGEGLDPNPAAEFDPAVGESYEFHVGLRETFEEPMVARIRDAVEKAVASSRNFQLA